MFPVSVAVAVSSFSQMLFAFPVAYEINLNGDLPPEQVEQIDGKYRQIIIMIFLFSNDDGSH